MNGQNFNEALDLIEPKLNRRTKEEATKNASQIMEAVVNAYSEKVNKDEVGKIGEGAVDKAEQNTKPSTGLVYGKIQSGKTRAMILSTALAFDNKFQVVVVVTTNNNRLLEQTHRDFKNGLPGRICVYSKTHFQHETDQAKQILKSGKGGVVVVCPKGSTRLNQVIQFLKKIDAKEYPAIIFDDEGDQATLDTHTFRRSTKDPSIEPSTIHKLVHDPVIDSVRKELPRHVFVSVTGTPSGIVLQNADSNSRPSFIELLEPGKEYVGGEHFFGEPKGQKNKLISLIDMNERIELLGGEGNEIPNGLKRAIRFFLLATTTASQKLGWPKDGTGYKLLCHPSVKIADQEKVANLVRAYLNDIAGAFTNPSHHLHNDLEKSYEELKKQIGNLASFETLTKIIDDNFNAREVLLINANTTSDQLNYSKYFNFLIGGNTLGRGLVIKNLLVTYYVREAKVTQMDTMYQHARMFGYRKNTLPYTKVFLPPQLYERFRQIFVSDEELREFIEKNKNSAEAFPVRISQDIRPTRTSVLDATKVNILMPGRQIYPNYPYFKSPESKAIWESVHAFLKKVFPKYKSSGKTGRTGVMISTKQAKKLVSLIKTNANNIWNDKKIPTILASMNQQFGDGIILKYRPATRTAGDELGLLAQGVLAGSDVIKDAGGEKPVLWIIDAVFSNQNKPPEWNGSRFIYPTIVVPNKSPLMVFNKS